MSRPYRSGLIIAIAALLSTCSITPTLLEEVRAMGELRVITRNSPITYSMGRAGPEGPEYDLVRGFAKHLGVRLTLVEAGRFADLINDVEAGKVHMAAAGLTITAERASRVDFGPPYQRVSQQLIYRRGRVPPRSVADLAGRRLEVVAQSSYVETLQHARSAVPDLAWIENPTADAGELLNRVDQGEADFTVVDSNVFAIFQRYHPELRVAFDMATEDALAWAFPHHRGDRSLIDAAGGYLAALRASGDLEHIMERYYGHNRVFDYSGTQKFTQDVRNVLPAYRGLFKAAGVRADLDWRLIAAVGYQESQWVPAAVSPKGAGGIMMLTPDTATLMGIANPADPAQSIMGGAKYLWRMRKRIATLAPGIAEPDLTWMTLAAYNMGYGHLLDARRITRLNGGNQNRWIDVRDSLPLLMERRWYTKARWGYARGRETLVYVRNIRNYYDILVWSTEGKAGGQSTRAAVTAADHTAPASRARAPAGTG